MSQQAPWLAALAAQGARVGPWRSSEAALDFGNPDDEYRALTTAAGLIDLSTRTQIEFEGDDRATFLHNLSTNEIRKLHVGQGCEIFITNAQAHILAHGFVFCRSGSLVFDTVPELGTMLIEHFDRYLIREKVELHDRTANWADLLLAGPASHDILRQCGLTLPEDPRLTHAESNLLDTSVSLRRVEMAGHACYLLACAREHLPAIWSTIVTAGARPCGQRAYEMCRLETGFPEYGVDIGPRNLPQEVQRDDRAISFTKGCYIGQETVARIDALGHVNKLLVGLRFLTTNELPPPGTELRSGDHGVGQVTSATPSPRLASPLALGYVRRGHHAPGTSLDSSLGLVEVVRLPIE